MPRKGPNPTGRGSLGCVTCPVTCPASALSPHQLSQNQSFPLCSKASPRKTKIKMSLVPTSVLFCALPETPQLPEPAQSCKRKKSSDFLCVLAFPARTKPEAARNPASHLQRKKVDGQRLCQTNSCCCSCCMHLPGCPTKSPSLIFWN